MQLLFLVLIKLLGWIAFVFAVGNLISNIASYIKKEPGSAGTAAVLRMIMTGAAFTIWDILK
jgi:hypothetical protein